MPPSKKQSVLRRPSAKHVEEVCDCDADAASGGTGSSHYDSDGEGEEDDQSLLAGENVDDDAQENTDDTPTMTKPAKDDYEDRLLRFRAAVNTCG